MENLNYIRQFKKWAKKTRPEILDEMPTHMQVMRDGIKFILPNMGRTLPDGTTPEQIKQMMAEDYNFNLPYKDLVLEFSSDTVTDAVFKDGLAFNDTGMRIVHADKRIVLASDLDDFFMVAIICHIRGARAWSTFPFLRLKKSDLATSNTNEIVQVAWLNDAFTKKYFMRLDEETRRAMYADMFDDIGALVDFLAALSCRNVVAGAGHKDKAGISNGCRPFDEYKRLVLTNRGEKSDGVDNYIGERHGPREHLRRGHIRRLEKGNVWVNSTIVNAGAEGKIYKEYQLKGATA
jgi:hypothetical protein